MCIRFFRPMPSISGGGGGKYPLCPCQDAEHAPDIDVQSLMVRALQHRAERNQLFLMHFADFARSDLPPITVDRGQKQVDEVGNINAVSRIWLSAASAFRLFGSIL